LRVPSPSSVAWEPMWVIQRVGTFVIGESSA
jgi:hypothetical protein